MEDELNSAPPKYIAVTLKNENKLFVWNYLYQEQVQIWIIYFFPYAFHLFAIFDYQTVLVYICLFPTECFMLYLLGNAEIMAWKKNKGSFTKISFTRKDDTPLTPTDSE